jgi:hypothetical protein
MAKAGPILADAKTLMFFLGSLLQQGELGTIMTIVQSRLHIIYTVFLRREIIKTSKNDQGIFSFQFGPQKYFEGRENIHTAVMGGVTPTRSSTISPTDSSKYSSLCETVNCDIEPQMTTPQAVITDREFGENQKGITKLSCHTGTQAKIQVLQPSKISRKNDSQMASMQQSGKVATIDVSRSVSKLPRLITFRQKMTEDLKGLQAPTMPVCTGEESSEYQFADVQKRGSGAKSPAHSRPGPDFITHAQSPAHTSGEQNTNQEVNRSHQVAVQQAKISVIPSKRTLQSEPGQNLSAPKIHELTVQSECPSQSPMDSLIADEKDGPKIALLKKQIEGLQIALMSATKNMLKVENMSRTNRDAIFLASLVKLQTENDTLKRGIGVLLSQNRILSRKLGLKTCFDPKAEIQLSPIQITSCQKGSEIYSPSHKKWQCRWRDCFERHFDKATLWRHIVSNHIRKQTAS